MPGRLLSALILLLCAAALPLAAGGPDERTLARLADPPLGLPPVVWPEDNPPTAAKVALGRKLFFDRRLSANDTMSCGMCHVPEQGFTSNELATPIGVEGRSIRRNAPTILNVAYQRTQFHDGRAATLEAQAIGPLLAHNEMANPSADALVEKIESLPDYDGLFERAFGRGVSIGRIGRAIASWERTMVAGRSPFDRWRYGGEENALNEQQKRGFALFTGKAGCAACHRVGERPALFTDHAFHDTGLGYRGDRIAADSDAPVPVEIVAGVVVPIPREAVESVGLARQSDLGRHEVTGDPDDRWRFKTPSLRNVALTAPYMHDGSLSTLEQVARYYDRGGEPHPGLDPRIRPLGLEEDEIAALVAFLESLTGAGIDELVADARSVPVGN